MILISFLSFFFTSDICWRCVHNKHTIFWWNR